jgi:LysM repeat protein
VNSLKPIILLVVLGGVAYGVYRSLSKESQVPPPGVDTSVTAAPDIKLGDLNANVAKDLELKTAGPNLLRPENSGVAPPFNAAGTSPDTAAAAAPVFNADVNRNAAAELNPPQAPVHTPHSAAAAQQHPAGDTPFSAAWTAIQPSLNAGQLAAALKELSAWHDHPSLNAQEREMVDRLLGQLAGTVIYSREHRLAAPYQVQPGDRLEDIAAKWKITPELLAKINGLDPAATVLPPGQELKVVPGPFSAVLDVGGDRLTVLLDGCYAGSFPVADVGSDVSARVGSGTPVELAVSQKTTSPIYNSAQG